MTDDHAICTFNDLGEEEIHETVEKIILYVDQLAEILSVEERIVFLH